jgi:hypothetical protein
LRGKYLSLTHGALGSTTNLSELFAIDQVVLTNGLYHVCFTNDHFLEITNGTTSVEQVAPLRSFTGSNTFEIVLSSSQMTLPPGAPAAVTAFPENNQVTLIWNPVFGATSYNVKRATVPGGPYTTLGNTTNSSYLDTTAVGGMTHYYVVSAVNQFGEGLNSAVVSTTPLLPANLVAQFNFDDGTARDSSGYGNHGTLLNGASVVADAQRGNVLLLDLSDNNQATITAWVKMAVSKANNSIVTKGEWKDSYSLLINGNAATKDQLWTGNDTGVFSGPAIPLNTWTHVAVVINGDLTTYYINGQIAGTANQDRGNAIDNVATGVSIGREQWSGSLPAGRWFFNGRLDDVRIYQTALAAGGIQNAMSNVVNQAPTFTVEPIVKSAGQVGTAYSGSLAGDATDGDAGDSLTFSKVSGPAWLNVAAAGGLSGTPQPADVGNNSFTVRVTDSSGWFDETTLNLSIAAANTAPVLAVIGNKSANEGALLSFTASAADSDLPAQTLTYSLDAGAPTGASINASSGAFTWTPTEAQGPGTYNITVRVTDSGAPSMSASETIQVTINEVNANPVLAAIGNQAVVVGTPLTFTASAADGDLPAQTLTYSLDAGAPAGATINATTGVFTWTPATPGSFAITVRVTDSTSGTAAETIQVNVSNSDRLVARITFDDGTANDSSGLGHHGVFVNGAAVVTDSERGNVLSLNGVNQYVDLGNGGFLDLSDNNQATITAWVKPVTSKAHHAVVTKGEWKDAYSLLINGNTATKDQLWTGNDTGVFSGSAIPLNTWTHVAVVINGDLTTFYVNGQLSGTANQDRGTAIDNTTNGVSIGREQYSGSLPAGRWFFNGLVDEVRLYESALAAAEIQTTLGNTAPVLAAIGNQSGSEGTLLTFTASALDPDTPAQTLTYSLATGAPSGAAISGSGVFTWTPTEGQGPGTYDVTVRVTDNGTPNLSDTETIQITVSEVNANPVLAAIGNKSVDEGALLSFAASATDSDAPAQPLTYSLDAGAPAGAGLNASSGVFTWTPTEAQGPGNYNITVRVTDSLGASDTELISIVVNEVNTAPVLAVIGDRTNGIGTNITFTAAATDADVPAQALTYSLDAGAPAGATINATSGVFSWTPASAGTFTVTVRVTDSLGGTDFETIQIVVSSSDVVNGLVGHWKFDENAGTTAADASGLGNPGTLVNSPGWAAPGKVGAAALSFTAASLQAVSVPNATALNSTTGLTISVWLNPTDWSGNRRLVQKGNSDNQYRLLVESGVLKFHLSGVGTLTAALPPVAVWTHVAATWNGATLVIYTNGVQQASLAAGGTLATTPDALSIGRKSATAPAGDHFNGLLDEVRIYNRGLSAAEVATIVGNLNLPSPWQTLDIGTVSQAGSATYSGGVYTVSGAGADIWGPADNFRFVHQALTGDGEIKVRVSSATGPHAWAKLGVMIRESLNANSANAMMLITPTTANGFSFQVRTGTGATSTQTLSAPANAAPNNWVRLVRSGNTLTGYKSADGIAWTQVGTPTTITMAANIYIGLAVTAHNSTGLATGTFDNLTVVP